MAQQTLDNGDAGSVQRGKINNNALDAVSKSQTTPQSLASSLDLPGLILNGGDEFDNFTSGNWTPSIPGIVLTIKSATWRRWGDMCYVECSIEYDSGTGSGQDVGGSPFPAKTTTRPGVDITSFQRVSVGSPSPSGLVLGSVFRFYGLNDDADRTDADFSTLRSGSELLFSATFQIEVV
jgi:hypothetical protein